ncbi:Protein of unknown function [Pyronema omphalodes CBS 100304]|uniref:Uncharacterized protein n=1 Tax=Pyronema omphalodes (strain CBS 100304) TaxID=1076935 RepID=U4LRS7_PYROM|nr:Protein of unknown function [Pyronema omphalodes CBS 100304]
MVVKGKGKKGKEKMEEKEDEGEKEKRSEGNGNLEVDVDDSPSRQSSQLDWISQIPQTRQSSPTPQASSESRLSSEAPKELLDSWAQQYIQAIQCMTLTDVIAAIMKIKPVQTAANATEAIDAILEIRMRSAQITPGLAIYGPRHEFWVGVKQSVSKALTGSVQPDEGEDTEMGDANTQDTQDTQMGEAETSYTSCVQDVTMREVQVPRTPQPVETPRPSLAQVLWALQPVETPQPSSRASRASRTPQASSQTPQALQTPQPAETPRPSSRAPRALQTLEARRTAYVTRFGGFTDSASFPDFMDSTASRDSTDFPGFGDFGDSASSDSSHDTAPAIF